MIYKSPHIIAVFNETDFVKIQGAMQEFEWIRSVTFIEYNDAVEKSLETARNSGISPATFMIEASDYLDWCKCSGNIPSEISVSAYIREKSKNGSNKSLHPTVNRS